MLESSPHKIQINQEQVAEIVSTPRTQELFQRYWLWHGMVGSYRSLRTQEHGGENARRSHYLRGQIFWHYVKNFFYFPIWLLSLLVPRYLKGEVTAWTNLKTILTSSEFQPLRLAILTQIMFLYVLIHLGYIVYTHFS